MGFKDFESKVKDARVKAGQQVALDSQIQIEEKIDSTASDSK